MAGSLGLRVVLAVRGGQGFWPDEGRFEAARNAARHIIEGQWLAAANEIFSNAEHLLFKLISIGPALVEQTWHTPPAVPALFFAGVSTGLIWLIGQVVVCAGGGPREKIAAMLAAACSTSLFYYSRHFFPYDLALCFVMQGVIVAQGDAGWMRSVGTGALAGCAFLTYNGYWLVAAVPLLVLSLSAGKCWATLVKRAGLSVVGFALTIALTITIGRLLGHDLVRSFFEFSSTVTQGDFRIGWRLVPQYLWITDGVVVLYSAVAVVTALLFWRRMSAGTLAWSGLCVLLYVGMVIPSDVVPKFALSARHIREVVPFLCVAFGLGCGYWWRTGARPLFPALLFLTMGVQAAWNFTPVLRQWFPGKFQAFAEREVIPRAAVGDLGPYKIVNATFLHNPTWAPLEPDQGKAVFRRDHPFQFYPYLFEGYSEKARADYRRRDLSMRVVRLNAGGAPFTEYPGPIKLTFKLREPLQTWGPDPLLVTGHQGAGDVLYVDYPQRGDDAGVIAIGHDHWGAGVLRSDPIRSRSIARARIHSSYRWVRCCRRMPRKARQRRRSRRG